MVQRAAAGFFVPLGRPPFDTIKAAYRRAVVHIRRNSFMSDRRLATLLLLDDARGVFMRRSPLRFSRRVLRLTVGQRRGGAR